MRLEEQQQLINKFYNKLFYGQESVPTEHRERINKTFNELSQMSKN